jgi:pimeloyl-ACP methyl ester carboxylesterase
LRKGPPTLAYRDPLPHEISQTRRKNDAHLAELERPNLKQKLIVDGAGHWIQQERPDQVNAALIGFLKEAIGK